MKKLFTIIITIALIATIFAGCGAKGGNTATAVTLKVGLIQLVEHPSLDEIRESFTTELEALAKAQGITVSIDYKNAQADTSLVNNICRTFVDQKVDIIVAIATPAAQGAASVTQEIPIIFSAVTDPVAAGLMTDLAVPSENITGVSDAINVEEIFKLAQELTPDISSYGLIYNKSESNSVSVIDDAKAYLDSIGVSYTEKVVGNSSEVQQVSRILLESCDAIFAPIDNTVASSMNVLADEAIAAGKPVYVAADSMVADGGLATIGVNYTELGKLTAEMTVKALTGTPVSEMPVEVMTDITPVVNSETAEAIGVDVSKYA